ncbi:hypothetical protein SRDD_19530 [Serratia sp. DD3]|nr:hypothetical protein SRDD_19530 [Serratia sp. DD3]
MHFTAKLIPHRIAETEVLAGGIDIYRPITRQRIIEVEQPGGGDIQVIACSLHIKPGSGIETGEFIQSQTGITVDVDQAIEASQPSSVARQIDIAGVEPPGTTAGEGVGEHRRHITGKVQELQGTAAGDVYHAITQVLLQADGQLAVAINSKQPVEEGVITGQ